MSAAKTLYVLQRRTGRMSWEIADSCETVDDSQALIATGRAMADVCHTRITKWEVVAEFFPREPTATLQGVCPDWSPCLDVKGCRGDCLRDAIEANKITNPFPVDFWTGYRDDPQTI